jgi:predicted SnoaL-like aldol condensation-catalyzing enzyme
MQRDTIVRLYEQVIRAGQFDALDELVAPDYRPHLPAFRGHPTLEPGRPALRARLGALAGLGHRVARLIVDGDVAIAHVKYEEPIPMAGADVFRLGSDGRIVEHWNVRQPLPAEGGRGDDRFANELSPDPSLAMSPAQLRAHLQQLLIEFWSRGQASLLGKYYDPSYIQHNAEMPGGYWRIKEIIENDIPRYIAATGGPYPIEIHRIAAQGDLVCAHISIFMAGIGRDDGRRSTNVDIFRINAQRRMVEHWDVLHIDGVALPSTKTLF